MEKDVLIKIKNQEIYSWSNLDGNTYQLDLGTMNKAIILRKNINHTWSISEGSYFPFPKSYYDMRFPSFNQAGKMSVEYIGEWLSETIKVLGL